MIVTKLWFVRGMETCIVQEIVCECVGTVCMALLGMLGGCTMVGTVHI